MKKISECFNQLISSSIIIGLAFAVMPFEAVKAQVPPPKLVTMGDSIGEGV